MDIVATLNLLTACLLQHFGISATSATQLQRTVQQVEDLANRT
jgi:hypothetical protein